MQLKNHKNCYQSLQSAITISGAIVTLLGNYALAQSQIVPDRTLGAESSTVSTAPDSLEQIEGGAIRDNNLFHSFQEFNIGEGREAYFLSPNANIQNILARVTGSNASEILGTLGTRGASRPNLFLINPNGIIFGQNARLDVGGSFVASTASSLKFAGETDFSATEPQTAPLLSVNVPNGLQFGAAAGRIVNQSVVVDSDGIAVGLQVQPGKTLALVGGNVALEGGTITAASGRIELGSVANTGVVSLTPIAQGWTLEYEGVQNFKDIQLSQSAFVNVGAEKGGDVQIQGRSITLTDASSIQAYTTGELSGGTVSVNASDTVELGGLVSTGSGFSYSNLQTNTFGTGSAGDLNITTRKLTVKDGAFISTSTISAGNGGNLTVTALDSIELIGSRSGLFSQTEGTGNAGNLTITARELSVKDGAQVAASTFGSGQGGELRVNATDSIDLTGVDSNSFSSGLFTRTIGEGNSGNITVDTNAFRIADGAVVNARTTAAGNGGNITVNAKTFEAVGGGQILASAFKGSSGRAGNITVNITDSMHISGSFPNSIQRLIQVAPDVLVENDDPANSGLFVLSRGSQNAGSLEIKAGSISLENEGILTATSASGEGGNIRLRDLDLLLLRGNSEIVTDATAGAGNGGNINIDTDLLVAAQSSNITANAVEGKGGNIRISTQGLFLSPDSQIAATSERGIDGVVEINRPDIDPSADLVVLPAQTVDVSRLVAQDCGAGGNVASRSQFVVTGRGGLPPTPSEAARSDVVLVDLGAPDRENRIAVSSSNMTNSEPVPLVEANGWVIGDKGEVVLTAQATISPDIPWMAPAACRASKSF